MARLATLTVAAFCALAPLSAKAARDWKVGADAAWAGDPTVNVLCVLFDGSPTGPKLGPNIIITGPIPVTGAPAPLGAAQYDGSGKVVFATCKPYRGAAPTDLSDARLGPAVSDSITFQLNPAKLLQQP